MSWLRDILDPAQWSTEPVATAAKTVACTIGAPVCLAVEVSETQGRAAELERIRLEQAARAERGTIGNALHDFVGAGDQVLDRFDETTSNINRGLMWVSIAIIAIFAIVLIGAIVYFALPFVAFAKA